MTRSFPNRPGRPDRLAVLDIVTIAPPAADGGFPPWPVHDPIVASMLTASRERYSPWQFALHTVDFIGDGAAAIERVSHMLEGRTVVTYEGRAFDLPVLALTAMKNQRFDLAGISRAWQANRFSGCHYDVADILGGFGADRGASFERLCAVLGIPAMQESQGSDIAELMAQRQFQAIQNHVENNVAATLCLFACVEGLRSADAGYAATLISQFSRWIADRQLKHLKAFERIAGCGEYDRLSLLTMVEEGIDSLDHRQHLKFVNNLPGNTGTFIQPASDF